MQPSSETRSHKRYVFVLCAVAALILAAGVFFRPENTPPPVRSESEILQLQLAAQRRDLERRSVFFTTKAQQLVHRATEARTEPARFPTRIPAPGEVVLLVGLGASGEPLWASAATAGSAQSECGEEIATTISIPQTLTDATAFDLDDNLIGLVISCRDRRELVTPQAFAAWKADREREQALMNCCGLAVAKRPDGPGITIISLQPDARLARAGARAGDHVLAIGGTPVEDGEQIRIALQTGEPLPDVSIEREGRKRRLRVAGLPSAEAEARR